MTPNNIRPSIGSRYSHGDQNKHPNKDLTDKGLFKSDFQVKSTKAAQLKRIQSSNLNTQRTTSHHDNVTTYKLTQPPIIKPKLEKTPGPNMA